MCRSVSPEHVVIVEVIRIRHGTTGVIRSETKVVKVFLGSYDRSCWRDRSEALKMAFDERSEDPDRVIGLLVQPPWNFG